MAAHYRLSVILATGRLAVSRSLWVTLCALLLTAVPAVAQPLRGKAAVIDGDSLRIGRREVRLFGVDAFEYTQTCRRMACGKLAALYLEAMVGKQTVVCIRKDVDMYGRVVALCRLPDGRDLGQEMVRAGYAVAYREYTPQYVMDEAAAKKAKAGAWSHGFQQPAAYRQPTGSRTET